MAKKRKALIFMGREYTEKNGAIELYHLWIGKQKKNERVDNMLALYRGIEERTKFLEDTAEGFARRLCSYGCYMDIQIFNGARIVNGNVVIKSNELERQLVQQFWDILAGKMDSHLGIASSAEPTSN